MRAAVVLSLVVSLAITACSSPAEPTREPSFEQGSTFPPLSLIGYLDKNSDGKLGVEEYGPVHPADVVHAYPNAELLLVHVAFEWCKYCWEETADQMAWARHYGGRFMSMQIMVETRDGQPGERRLLDSWIQAHKSGLPTMLEPAQTLFAHFGRNASYLLLDPKDGLRVLAVGAGPPQFALVRDTIRDRLGALPPSASPH